MTASPDGQYLAFGLWDNNAQKSGLAVWSLTRHERRTQLPASAGMAPPAWYSDSRHLLYKSAGRAWRVSVEGGEPESLGTDSSLDCNEAGLSMHPGGNRVAFVAERDRRSEVWVIPGLLRGR